jgi:hypothetical protein
MTAVEWLHQKLAQSSQEELVGNINLWFKQAKEMEKEQLECAWNSSDQNMRFQFSSSAYKPITFKQWLEIYKKENKL